MCFWGVRGGVGGAFRTASGTFLWATGNERREPELERQLLERKREKGECFTGPASFLLKAVWAENESIHSGGR